MRGRPGRGLARAVVGTAVVAGTAGAVHHHQEQRWANKEQQAYEQQAAQQQLAQQQAQIDQLQQQQYAQPQYAPPPPQYAPPPQQYAPPPPAESATVAQLNQLSQLYASGILSAEEFAAAKQKVLSGG